VYVPGKVAARVISVYVAVPDPVTDVGLKAFGGPTFAGRPEEYKFTVPLKPFTAVIVTVYVAVPGRPTVRDLGETEMVKFGTLTTS
jgi:hypothetical protein